VLPPKESLGVRLKTRIRMMMTIKQRHPVPASIYFSLLVRLALTLVSFSLFLFSFSSLSLAYSEFSLLLSTTFSKSELSEAAFWLAMTEFLGGY